MNVEQQSSGKKGKANLSSIDNPLELNSKLFNQLQSEKKQEEKKVTINSVLENLRRKLTRRGARGLIGLAKQFRVLINKILIINRFWMILIMEH